MENAFSFSQILLWLKTSGLHLLVIVFGGFLLIRLFHAVADRILRLMAGGEGPAFTEREKRARTLAGLLRTLGTTLVVILVVIRTSSPASSFCWRIRST